jgi:IS5 family transposase
MFCCTASKTPGLSLISKAKVLDIMHMGTSKIRLPRCGRNEVELACEMMRVSHGPIGIFDLSHRYDGLDKKKDPLVTLASVVPWETFRTKLEAAIAKHGLRRAPAERKSPARRKPWEEVLIFKALIVQSLYNLSDEQMEYQLRDRLSFMRFLGLGLEDTIPDATTLWLYREALAKAGAVEELFDAFDGYLSEQGYLAKGGQIIDATIVAAPKQRNRREENETIKQGQTPSEWEDQPNKRRQKDTDAHLRWRPGA